MTNVVPLIEKPTTEERYRHMRENAEAFVASMATLIASLERGDGEQVTAQRFARNLKVWCLMPWQAAINADDTGDLWPVCESCLKPIKNDAERVSGDACDFHRACVG